MGGAKLRWALKCPFHKMVKAGQGAGFVQFGRWGRNEQQFRVQPPTSYY